MIPEIIFQGGGGVLSFAQTPPNPLPILFPPALPNFPPPERMVGFPKSNVREFPDLYGKTNAYVLLMWVIFKVFLKGIV